MRCRRATSALTGGAGGVDVSLVTGPPETPITTTSAGMPIMACTLPYSRMLGRGPASRAQTMSFDSRRLKRILLLVAAAPFVVYGYGFVTCFLDESYDTTRYTAGYFLCVSADVR